MKTTKNAQSIEPNIADLAKDRTEEWNEAMIEEDKLYSERRRQLYNERRKTK